MSAITTHVLDTARGAPAAGVAVTLAIRSSDSGWVTLGKAVTDADGRARDLLPQGQMLKAGTYRLLFDTGAYLPEGLYPEVAVTFRVADPARPCHIPLLLSPYGYTTYRGS